MGYKVNIKQKTFLIALLLILIPLTISFVSSSDSTSEDNITLSNINVELYNGKSSYFRCDGIIPGQWYYVNFTLDKSVGEISLIAYNINDDTSCYQWKYGHGEWKETDDYSSRNILPFKCSKDGNRYSFLIRINPTGKTGKWRMKVFADNEEVYSINFYMDGIKKS